MTETPDVSADVVERLAELIEGAAARHLVHWEAPNFRKAAVRALVAHLRAHPEDAAAVLGGEVVTDEPHYPDDRPAVRVVGPWSEENA